MAQLVYIKDDGTATTYTAAQIEEFINEYNSTKPAAPFRPGDEVKLRGRYLVAGYDAARNDVRIYPANETPGNSFWVSADRVQKIVV